MQIFHGLDDVPADLGLTVLTIGNFDGVHQGHQHLLNELVNVAGRYDAAPLAITFDPHPALVHRPESAPELLTGTQEKLRRLQSCGLAAALVLDYTEEVYLLSAERFVQQYLLPLTPAAVVVGADVRFGRGNEGDFGTMVQLGERFGFEVIEVEDFPVDDLQAPDPAARCSSTAIRRALTEGHVAAAAQMLGRPHTVAGEVVHGEARGRELGFPTANLAQDAEGMVPADGVYAGWVTDRQAHRWPAAISVGTNPTFDGVQRVVEAHVLDRPDEPVEEFDLYGQHLRVEFVDRLRGMVAYEGVEKLVTQMHQDVREARQVLLGAPAGLQRPLP
ncbi:bifunctional riboflavin kinase/FAD synthetase [Nesterenkonia ebinurensis]|uniref:bifunctional riboflavin kinase/FAD synthetase n=1 Tax=Nesterenkonia ebinurensis TaxID=2608252 RepID=UPI001CC7DC1A|nr:bifunctional riboflavin kinase/FAD synthetase [Nesterenkonia ebinurensis]